MASNKIIIEVPDANIPLRAVPRIAANAFGGEPVSRQAVYQWTKEGRKAANGKLIRLRTARVNGQLHTSLAWIKEFIEAL